MGFSGFAKDSRYTGTDLTYYTCKREQISQLLVPLMPWKNKYLSAIFLAQW